MSRELLVKKLTRDIPVLEILPSVLRSICFEYMVSWEDLANEEIKKYKLSWDDLNDNGTIYINWHNVFEYLTIADSTSSGENITFNSLYYLAIIYLGNVGNASYDYNKVTTYISRAINLPNVDKDDLDFARALQLFNVLKYYKFNTLSDDDNILKHFPHLKDHPYVVAIALYIMNYEPFHHEYIKDCEEKYCGNVSISMIDSILNRANKGDPHAQWTLSHLYYSTDLSNSIDENGNERGSVWTYNYKKQGYNILPRDDI